MKLRIHGNSIRIRLDEDECRRIARDGRLESQLLLGIDPSSRFSYSLETDAAAETPFAELRDGRLRVVIHPLDAAKLATGEKDVIEGVQAVGEEVSVGMSVERDCVP